MAGCGQEGRAVKAAQHPPEVPEGIHLNLGCGKKLWPGFVNIDFPSNWSGKKPDVECDLREIPIADGYADSAWAIHVLEHFYRWETEEVVREWIRVLKPGGRLIIEVPCLDKIFRLFNYYVEKKVAPNPQATLWGLFGNPNYKNPHMTHKWCFHTQELLNVLKSCGLEDVKHEEPEYHAALRDIRVSGVKRG